MGSLNKECGIAQQGRERMTDCQIEGEQSAQELANELTCGNPSRSPRRPKMLPFEKHAQPEQGNNLRTRAKNSHAASPFLCGYSLLGLGASSQVHTQTHSFSSAPLHSGALPTYILHALLPLKSSTPTLASTAAWQTGPDAETRSPDGGLGSRSQHKQREPNKNNSPQRPPP